MSEQKPENLSKPKDVPTLSGPLDIDTSSKLIKIICKNEFTKYTKMDCK